MTGVEQKAETTDEFIQRLQQTSLDLLHGDIETTEFALRRINKLRIFAGAFLLLFVSIEAVDVMVNGLPAWTAESLRSRIYSLASFVGILIVLFISTKNLQHRLLELTNRLEAIEKRAH